MDNGAKTPQWDRARDEKLIELVKSKPALYDLTSLHYNDNVERRRNWVKISRQLGCEGSRCKERWESLRSQHRKYLSKAKGGQGVANSPKWKYAGQMSFLTVFMKERTRTSSLQQAGDESEISEDATPDEEQEVWRRRRESEENEESVGVAHVPLPHQERLRRKRKRRENLTGASAPMMRYLVENVDKRTPEPIDTFFSLMASTVKKFSPADQHFIKTKVFSLVSEIEGTYIHNPNTQNVWPIPSSPALSQYSYTSSTSTQSVQTAAQYHDTIPQDTIKCEDSTVE